MNSHHRRGKIARLPQSLRDLVNRLLADGAEYKQIIGELEKHREQWPPGITGFNKTNITQWRMGGYKEWLANNELREDRRADREQIFELLRDKSSSDIERAVPAVAQLKLFDLLFRTDTGELAEQVGQNPNQYSRMINSLSKLRKS